MDEKIVTVLCGWLIDGKGGKAQKDVVIRITDSRIVSVSTDRPPQDGQAQILDYSDCTVIPGLVDAHIHLAMSGDTDPAIRKSQLSVGYESAVPVMEKNIREMFRHGISGARDGGDAGGHALMFKEQALKESTFDFSAAGRGWHGRGRYGSFVGRAPEEGRPLADTFKAGAHSGNHLKIINSGINSLIHYGKLTPPQFSAADLATTVQAAIEDGLQVMVHGNGERPVKEALEAGCTSIEHGYFMGPENLERLAEKGVVWVPTICPVAAVSKHLQVCGQDNDVARRTLEHQLDQLRRAREMGVVVTTGTDAGSPGVFHGSSLAWELAMFTRAGYRIEEAVACSSVNGSKLLNKSRSGIIKRGAEATFAAFTGAPDALIKSPQKIRLMIIKGKKVGNYSGCEWFSTPFGGFFP
jgi:imidazolonepropionase-like amidohydrolase